MSRSFRSVVPVALLLVLALTVAACGGSSGGSGAATPAADVAPQVEPVPERDAGSEAAAEQARKAERADPAPADAPRLPDVEVEDIRSGEKLSLASLAPSGKPLLVWFWAPHCPTCNAEAPGVETFSREHADELTVIGLGAQDSLDMAKEFVDEHGVKTPRMLYDSSFDSWSHFGVNGQPAAILFDRSGAAREGWFGPFDEQVVLDKARALS
jgi:thiol-disulfide isomerase/thioredoxin